MVVREANIDRLVTLGAAIDAAPLCVFVADTDMRYVAVNAYACELLGYSEEELLTMRVSDIATYTEAPEEYESMMATAYLRGRSRIRCKDGEELVLSYVAGEVEIDGRSLYVSVGQPEFSAE
jgi:PAS domain S-box-containing protein